MHILDNLETKFLFGLTRIFAMFVILSILIVAIVGGLIFGGLFQATNTNVPYTEVIDLIKPPLVITNDTLSTDSSSSIETPKNTIILPSVKMPFVLQKHFNTPEKLQILKNWLDSITLEKRQEFIDEMTIIVTETEKLKLSVDEAIDKYKELKFNKIEAEAIINAERKTQQLYYLGAIVSAIALIALFSLILVLLAIERNTRRT